MNSEDPWITDGAEMASLLYDLNDGATFAFRFDLSYGPSVKHVTVTKGSFTDTRNYSDTSLGAEHDTILKGEKRTEPGDEHPLIVAFAHDPDTDTVFLKRGPGQYREITGVTSRTLSVDYSSRGTLAARCECGQVTKVAVTEDDLPMIGDGMVQTDDGLVTPCCRSSDWTGTVIVEE